jgi:hypothetical protein
LNGWRYLLGPNTMRRAVSTVGGLALGLLFAPAEGAAPPNPAQAEIEHLLTAVQASGCEFYRNGSWYDATRAQAHLRQKLQLLTAHDPMRSAEEFIEKVATKSAFTNQPYEVRCRDGAAVAVNGWLREELKRYRQCATAGTLCASRPARDAPVTASPRISPDVSQRAER